MESKINPDRPASAWAEVPVRPRVAWPAPAAGWVVALVSVAVLAAAGFGISPGGDLTGGKPMMPLAAAVLFLLHASAIVLHRHGKTRYAVAALWAASGLALGIGAGHAGWEPGLAEAAAQWGAQAERFAVRPSLVTVAGLLALALGILAESLAGRQARRLAAILVSVCVAMGLIVAIGLLLGKHPDFSRGPLAPLTPLTAALLAFLGAAWLHALWRRDGEGDIPFWTPEAATAGMLVTFLSLALMLAHESVAKLAAFDTAVAHDAVVVWHLHGLPLLTAGLGTVIALAVGLLIRSHRDNALRIRQVNALATEVARANAALEERVTERTAELAASNRELELFAYTVAHDLRAPLRHIVSFGLELEAHAGAGLDPEGRRLLSVVTRSAQKQADFIHELLEYARMGEVAVGDVAVEVGPLLDEVVGSLAGEAREPATQWVLGPMPRVMGDPLLLRQALANLVGNAVKFSRKVASPRIEITAHGNAAMQTVTIRDNGAGFDPRYASKLFTPFQRLHHAADFPGSGMGLAIVRRVVERLGGTVQAESRPGEGAVFSLHLRTACAAAGKE